MSISGKATITTTALVTVHLDGYAPIKDLRKVSEWNGMWELRAEPRGKVILSVGVDDGFEAAFSRLFGKTDPTEAMVVLISPELLIPIERFPA